MTASSITISSTVAVTLPNPPVRGQYITIISITTNLVTISSAVSVVLKGATTASNSFS